jgi:hypothetical protein
MALMVWSGWDKFGVAMKSRGWLGAVLVIME